MDCPINRGGCGKKLQWDDGAFCADCIEKMRYVSFDWDTWKGRRAKNNVSGETYIETSPNAWDYRLGVWKSAHNAEYADLCPCPMPEGHIMFDNRRKSSLYRPITGCR